MKWFVIKLIRLYQLTLSPYVGWHCRFAPSCSNYMIEAISSHGVLRGGTLGVKRLLKCRPGGEEGFDPVPKADS